MWVNRTGTLGRTSAEAKPGFAAGIGIADCACPGGHPLICSAVLLAISASSLFALDPALSTTQYLHTSWTQEEGIALPAISALAQTTDGYLWLGTGTGLIRFDGMRFVRWEPSSGEKLPGEEIRYLLASADGSLWIGTTHTISRYDHGRIVSYPEADRWLAGRNRAISQDRFGRLWLVRASDAPEVGVLLSTGAFRVYGLADGLPDRSIRIIFEDTSSDLRIATDHDLCRWSPGRPAECVTLPGVAIKSVAVENAEDLLIADAATQNVLRFSGGMLKPIARRMEKLYSASKCLMRDHDGGVWIGTVGQGLLRVSDGRLERFTRVNGLSSDYIRAVLEDREQNLWVATARGLDRFRNPQVLHVSSAEGLSSDMVTGVYPAHDGGMWVGTTGGGLNRVLGKQITHYGTSSGLPSTTIRSLFEDEARRLWLGTTAGFGYLANRRFFEVRTRDGSPLYGVFAIAADRSGVIWLADAQKGLLTVTGGFAQGVSVPGVRTTDVYQLRSDRAGVLWIGYFRGGVTEIDGDTVRSFTSREGLAGGPIQAIAQDRSGAVWVGARDGLSRFRNGVWTTWELRHGVPEGGVQGIIADDHDALWLMTSQGLSRLEIATLNQSSDTSLKNLEFRFHGQSDGVRLAAAPVMANPRTAKAADGRLWICTDDGVAIVDPARIRGNPLPPPVAIEQIVVDGKPMDMGPAREVTFRGRQVHITYTGLSLMVPERTRFRYKLDGLDPDWTDAGARRNVDYVNLPPGRYRFHVIACNNDGVWNVTGAILAFRIKPYYYQTTWFAALCVTLPALFGWAIHRMRVRMVVTRYEAITQERTRLTRELHDSLLQGFVGVVYQLEAAARQLESAPELGKQRLERAIEQADRSLAEARRTMLSMRLPALESNTLPEALSAVANSLTDGTQIDFHLDVKGAVRQLPYDAQANVYLIGREAITNSVNHARPRRISAGLTYSTKQVRLIVHDDGEGFDPNTSAKEDHWGMAGMRERANQIGATLIVSSAPGKGTKVEVVVPSGG